MKTTLYDYQEDTARDIFNRMDSKEIKGAYLGFDTGTGKTVTSLSVAERLYNSKYINGIVVICPVSKVDDWKKDMKDELPEIEHTFVSSFQSAWREKNSKQIQEYLVRYKAMLIVDEGHKMKTYDSKQSKFIQNIALNLDPYMLILSATPQNKKYIDLYPQYRALRNSLFNVPAKIFKKDFCIEEANWNLVYAGRSRFPFNEIVGYKHMDEMNNEITNYTYYKKYESEYDRPIEIKQFFKMTSDMRYFKEKKVWPKMDEDELLSFLSDEAFTKYGHSDFVDDGTKDYVTYEEADDMKEELGDVYPDFIIANRPALHHIYMRESCSGFIRDMMLDKNPKLQWLEDFMEGNEGRFVVFTNFVSEAKLISELCEKKKRHYAIYDGGHKDLTAWHEHEDCIAIVNTAAGSAGLNDFILTNIAIFFSPPENYIDFTQAKGRIDRIGQTKQPVYYYLQIAGSVEPQIYKSLELGENFDLHLFERWLKEGGK